MLVLISFNFSQYFSTTRGLWMDKRIYLLTMIAFVVGMAELIIGGILDLIADDLHITIGQAGLFITIFSLIFAISAPILLIIYKGVERKKLTIIGLIIFFIGNLIAIFSETFTMLMLSRIVSAASGSLVVVLCINLASRMVEKAYRGRAIGLVVVGTSASLVLGLPIGVFLGQLFQWRTPFIFIAILTIVLLVAVFIYMEKINPRGVVPLRQQLATLKNNRLLFAHLTTFFFLAGHFTLYGYLTPYSQMMFQFSGTTISVLYLVYGIVAGCGGGIAGFASDRIGLKNVVYATTLFLAVILIVIPFTSSVSLFWPILIIWGVLSWGITPPIQTHIFTISPETSDL